MSISMVGAARPKAQHRWWPLLDWWIPPRILARGGDDRRRGRLTVIVLLTTAVLMLASAASGQHFGFSPLINRSNLIFAAVILAIPWLCRRTRSQPLFANTMISAGFAQHVLLIEMSGGSNLAAFMSLPNVVMCASLLAGWRSGFVFMGLCVAAILVVFLGPAGLATGGSDLGAMQLMRDALTITIGVGIFASMYDRIREAALHDSEVARARAERSERRTLDLSDQFRSLAESTHRVLEAPRETFGEQIRSAVRLSATFARAQRTILFVLDKPLLRDVSSAKPPRLSGQFSWSEGQNTTLDIPPSLAKIRRQLPVFAQQMQANHQIVVDDVSELPAEAEAERKFMESRGAQSLLILSARGALREGGFQLFERLNRAEPWTEDDIALLQLAVDGLTSATTSRRAEQALRDSEQKFSSVFAAHPESTFIATRDDFLVLECNAPFVRDCAEFQSSNVIGRRLTELRLGIDPTELKQITSPPPPGAPQAEIVSRRPGRADRILLASSSAIELEGQPCALVTMRDVTQLKDLEMQLGQAQKMDAVGRLAGGVAHDFNNMLTVISGYGEELMLKTQGSLRESAQEICTAAARSASLTHELLAFSRRQHLRAEIVEANPLVERLESMLRRLLGEHITIRLKLSPGTGYLKVDRGQIEQAIVNLAINARDAMPDGGTLTLATNTEHRTRKSLPLRDGLAAGCYVRITVRDDGNGMTPETSARAVEPFFSTKEADGGTGLGLSMADGIIRQSGGTLTLSSQPDKGTTAEILLPQFEPNLTQTDPASLEPSGRTVLLVEDETALRRLARKVLEDAGYQVIEAPNGRDALEVARNHVGTIDLLLSDIVMPNMSGPELARRLAQERPETRLAFMSGYPYRQIKGESALPRDALLINKPFKPRELQVTLSRLFESEPPAQHSASLSH